MSPAQIKYAIIAVVVLALCGASAKVGYDLATGKAAREELLIEKAGDKAAERAAKAIAGIQTKVYPIRERIESTIRELPAMPVECNTPTSIATDINEARKP